MQRAVIDKLLNGHVVPSYKEGGNSMRPLIKHQQPVTLHPIVDATKLKPGDIVLAKVGGIMYMHLIKTVKPGEVQIGNNHGRINGWTHLSNVYGVVIAVEGVARKNSQANYVHTINAY